MPSPRVLIADVEENAALPPGEEERFSGYAVMSVPFASGHVLGLRRFPVTSIGPGYTSVWLRDPAGAWTIYTSIPANLSCPRYFGSAIEATSIRDISVEWRDDQSFDVAIADAEVDLRWTVELNATRMTRAMSSVAGSMPEAMWRNGPFLRFMGAVSGPSLQAGHIGLVGHVPNRQSFKASPRRMWFVDSSSAVLNGVDLGRVAPLAEQTKLGDFWIPQRGIFMIGGASFEPADAEGA